MCHRILIIDDRDSILFAMSEYFTANGYEVDCARKIEEAERLLSDSQYSVVISDLHLNGSEGAEGLEIIGRVRQQFPRTRTILLTAYGSPDIELEAHRLGVDALLYKSKPLLEVAQVIFKLLDSRPEELHAV
jgi:DNA-binding NtrC family response regulator